MHYRFSFLLLALGIAVSEQAACGDLYDLCGTDKCVLSLTGAAVICDAGTCAFNETSVRYLNDQALGTAALDAVFADECRNVTSACTPEGVFCVDQYEACVNGKCEITDTDKVFRCGPFFCDIASEACQEGEMCVIIQTQCAFYGESSEANCNDATNFEFFADTEKTNGPAGALCDFDCADFVTTPSPAPSLAPTEAPSASPSSFLFFAPAVLAAASTIMLVS